MLLAKLVELSGARSAIDQKFAPAIYLSDASALGSFPWSVAQESLRPEDDDHRSQGTHAAHGRRSQLAGISQYRGDSSWSNVGTGSGSGASLVSVRAWSRQRCRDFRRRLHIVQLQ